LSLVLFFFLLIPSLSGSPAMSNRPDVSGLCGLVVHSFQCGYPFLSIGPTFVFHGSLHRVLSIPRPPIPFRRMRLFSPSQFFFAFVFAPPKSPVHSLFAPSPSFFPQENYSFVFSRASLVGCWCLGSTKPFLRRRLSFVFRFCYFF